MAGSVGVRIGGRVGLRRDRLHGPRLVDLGEVDAHLAGVRLAVLLVPLEDARGAVLGDGAADVHRLSVEDDLRDLVVGSLGETDHLASELERLVLVLGARVADADDAANGHHAAEVSPDPNESPDSLRLLEAGWTKGHRVLASYRKRFITPPPLFKKSTPNWNQAVSWLLYFFSLQVTADAALTLLASAILP